MAIYNGEATRLYPSWDDSYKSLLCLLLAVLGLMLLIMLFGIVIPGEGRNYTPNIRKDFDPVLYEKLMEEYRVRPIVMQTTENSMRAVTTTEASRNSESIFKSDESFISTNPIITVERQNRKSNSIHYFPMKHKAEPPFIEDVQKITEEFKLTTQHSTSIPDILLHIPYNESLDSEWENSNKDDTFQNTTSSKFDISSSIDDIRSFTLPSDSTSITAYEKIANAFKKIEVNKTQISDTSTTSTSSSEILTSDSEKYTINNVESSMDAVDANLKLATIAITLQQTQLNSTSEYTAPVNQTLFKFYSIPNQTNSLSQMNPGIVEDYKSKVGGSNIFEQKTLIKEIIVEKGCDTVPQVCSTNVCKRSASEMLALMDHGIDACDDFYWYACNGIEINRLEDRNPEKIILDKIKDFTVNDPLTAQIKLLYDSCVHFPEENYFYLRNYVEDIFSDMKYDGLSEVDALTELISTILLLNPCESNFRILPIFDLTVILDSTGPIVMQTTENSMRAVTTTEASRNSESIFKSDESFISTNPIITVERQNRKSNSIHYFPMKHKAEPPFIEDVQKITEEFKLTTQHSTSIPDILLHIPYNESLDSDTFQNTTSSKFDISSSIDDIRSFTLPSDSTSITAYEKIANAFKKIEVNKTQISDTSTTSTSSSEILTSDSEKYTINNVESSMDAVDANLKLATIAITLQQTQLNSTSEYTAPVNQTLFKFYSIPNQTNSLSQMNPGIVEDYKSKVGGSNIFEQKTLIKEIIVEKGCDTVPQVCSTNVCKRSASEMLALMDHGIDACDDFYWYACNGIEINRLEDRNPEKIILDKIKDFTVNDPLTAQIKLLYDSCVHFPEENYFYLRNYVEDIFNDMKYDGLSEVDALTELISTILLLNPCESNFRILPIFDLTVKLDSTGYFLPTLTLPQESCLEVVMNSCEAKCLKKISAKNSEEKSVNVIYQLFLDCAIDIGPYIINLNKTLYSMEALKHLPKLNRSQKIIDIEQSVQFDVFEVLGVISKKSRREHLESTRENLLYMDVEQLQAEYPQINWKKLLSNLFKEKSKDVKKIRIMFKKTLDNIFTFFQDNNFTDIKNLLMAMFLHDLHEEIKSVDNKCVDENYCLKLSTALMEDVAAKILASKINKKDITLADAYISSMFEQIKGNFNTLLQSAKWLSENQKLTLIEKLGKLKINANAYNLYFNNGVLAYRNSKLKLTNNFAENIIALKRNKRQLMYEKITNNPGSVWIYDYNPIGTEIFTVIERNEIIVPIGLLSKYAVKKRNYLRDYETYSKLGFQISRAILKFFTPFNLFKMLPDLKESEEFKNFLENKLADPPIIRLENMLGITMTKEDIKITSDERFSDDGGLRLAFETFSNNASIKNDPLIWLNFTSSQLFYISFAQEYCRHRESTAHLATNIAEGWNLPSYFRINSAIMNSAHFADTFNCRIGSSMNPEFKVNPFPYLEQSDIDYDRNQEV